MFTTRPEIMGTVGVVTSTHWLASAVGMAMLERGGNAFDAAVAAGMTLQVAEPHLNGPGGDLPLLLYRANEDRVRVICGQGVAPQAATIEQYRKLGVDMIPGSGLLAAVVPGAFDAWMLMLRDHGTLSLSDVFEPALHYAEHGVPLVARVSDTIGQVAELFRTEWTSSAAVYLPNGEIPKPGSLLANKSLAATWRRLIAEAKAGGGDREKQIDAVRDAWYQGFVAEAIDRFCRDNAIMDSTGRRHNGLLRGDDMAGWRASYEEPLTLDYGDYRACKCGPWSQGPTQLQMLALFKGIDVAAMDPLGADFVHTVVEVIKLAFADREAFYGDPNFFAVPMAYLLSAEYNNARRALIGTNASLTLCPGNIEGLQWRLPAAIQTASVDAETLANFGMGEPTVAKSGASHGDTCHLDIIDRWGNMVSATPSGGWLQSSPTIPELGFCLGSRAQMFWLEEELPASLAPGKRPRTTLTPSLALKYGRPYLAFGTPGGDQQEQWQISFFLRHVHHRMNLQEAIDAPSFHSEHFPSSFFPRTASPGRLVAEARFSPETLAELRRRGHLLEVGEAWSEGRLSAATQESGILKAAANPRGMQGYAVGR